MPLQGCRRSNLCLLFRNIWTREANVAKSLPIPVDSNGTGCNADLALLSMEEGSQFSWFLEGEPDLFKENALSVLLSQSLPWKPNCSFLWKLFGLTVLQMRICLAQSCLRARLLFPGHKNRPFCRPKYAVGFKSALPLDSLAPVVGSDPECL